MSDVQPMPLGANDGRRRAVLHFAAVDARLLRFLMLGTAPEPYPGYDYIEVVLPQAGGGVASGAWPLLPERCQ